MKPKFGAGERVVFTRTIRHQDLPPYVLEGDGGTVLAVRPSHDFNGYMVRADVARNPNFMPILNVMEDWIAPEP